MNAPDVNDAKNTQATKLPFLDELEWRGMLHQTTATREAVAAHLSTPGRIGYAGFDPTSNSLTIGNFIPIKLLMHLQRAGHRPIALIGGATGLIGDPSGRDSERKLLSEEQVRANVEGQTAVLQRFLDFDPATPNRAMVVDNAEWLRTLGFLEVLRSVGKYFSVNAMIQKDSVRTRLESREQGISYTEFSYMLLQAYDFLHLKREHGCSVQIAGSDQYGNIVAGVDLIHHHHGREGSEAEAYGVTAPLLLDSAGNKVGKSAGASVWLTADRTSPYAFYQYWINTPDADVANALRWFTFLNREAVDELLAVQAKAPHERTAQRALAAEMTALVHGREQLAKVEAASRALFDGEVRALDAEMLEQVFADVPHTQHARDSLGGEGVSLVELLPETSLAKSRREARQFLQSGAVSVNGERIDAERRLGADDLLHGATILIRRGKKLWHATTWQ
ncbi:MAG: tyrosine--tRNA ligase [Myxococcales bacterium]|nr:tyrosine--tRNA ligase [Myxococcales bacterium]